MKKEWWLSFDSLKFCPSDEWRAFKLEVLFDNCGGNYSETIVTFDTQRDGGNDMEVTCYDTRNLAHPTERVGRVSIKLYGSIEADAFFESMRNLVKAYDLREKIGD